VNPRFGLAQHSRITLGALLASCLIAGQPHAQDSPCPACEIQGRWRLLDGPWQCTQLWTFRHASTEQAALRICLPDGPWLGRRQYLLKDGHAVLQWAEPAGARILLGDHSPYVACLEALPASAWLAFLTGEGLEGFMAVERREQAPGARAVIVGELAGRPARLELSGGRCRRLLWGGFDLPLVCRWREQPEGRWRILELRSRDKPLLRLTMRPPRARDLSPEQWLFLGG